MGPVILELAAHGDQFEPLVITTGQHRELLQPALAWFGIHTRRNLGLLRPGQGPSELLSRANRGLYEAFGEMRPNVVLAQGDTVTALAAGLAAFHRGIPFGHLESGLRSGNRRRPFPEEMYRRLADELGDWLFAPTRNAADRLLSEGRPPERVFFTGNTCIDALCRLRAMAEDRPESQKNLQCDRLLVPATVHRRENQGAVLHGICRALADLARREDVEVLLAVHPNPAVSRTIIRQLGGTAVRLTQPLAYPQFVSCLQRAHMVLTDSGGVQEETSFLGIPTLVMRTETERPEAVTEGSAQLVGTDPDHILAAAHRLLSDPAEHARCSRKTSAFGDGRAAQRVAAILAGERPAEPLPDTEGGDPERSVTPRVCDALLREDGP